MNRKIKLTLKLQETICKFIQAGGFPHVAAEAAGLPKALFDDWMKKGEGATTHSYLKPYIQFRLAVIQAQAEARLAAEIKAHQDSPLVWLKQGPGKETPGSQGWTITPKPSAQTNNNINFLLLPEMQGVFAALLQILAPFPEARAAVAQALSKDLPKQIEGKQA